MGTGYTRNDGPNNIANGNVIDAADLDGEFDAIVASFASATGHTHDGTTSEGGVITVIGPVQDIITDATAIYPKTDAVYDLGKVAASFDVAYVESINLGGTGITATATEINYTDGVTSAIQTQLNAKQPLDNGLTSIAGLTTAADTMIYTTLADTYATTSLTAAGRALIDDASASAQRTTLGLGTAATTASTAYATAAQGTTADAALPKAGGTMTGNITMPALGTVDGVDISVRDAVLTSTTTTANAALPKAGGTMTGNITMPALGTVDGRDLSVDGAKLDAIEAGADVTDTTNVTAAGALMDSEVDADIKTLVLPASTTISTYGATLVDDLTAAAARTTLGLGTAATTASTAYATAAQGTKADSALQASSTLDSSKLSGALPAIDGSALTGIVAGVVFARKIANYTAAHLEGVIADTSAGTFTVTLPATPSTGDYVVITDGADWSTINLTVGRNASTIEGDAADMTMDLGGVQVTFLYDGTTWQVHTTIGSDASSFATAAQGTLADSAIQPGDSLDAGDLINALPAIDGSALTGLTGSTETVVVTAASWTSANVNTLSGSTNGRFGYINVITSPNSANVLGTTALTITGTNSYIIPLVAKNANTSQGVFGAGTMTTYAGTNNSFADDPYGFYFKLDASANLNEVNTSATGNTIIKYTDI